MARDDGKRDGAPEGETTPLTRWLLAGLAVCFFLIVLMDGTSVPLVAAFGVLAVLSVLVAVLYREGAPAPAPRVRTILGGSVLLLAVALGINGLLQVATAEERSPLSLLLAVPVLIVVVGLPGLIIVGQVQIHRQRAAARNAPIVDSGPEPDHDPLRPVVAELEAEGYAVDAFVRGLRDIPLVLVVHPDGSVAVVERLRRTRRGAAEPEVVVALSSALVPGEEWLVTTRSIEARALPWVLIDALPGTPSIADVLARHRSTRDWLATEGVLFPGTEPGRAVDDLRARIVEELAAPAPRPRLIPSEERRAWTPADLPGIEARLDAIRRRQATLAPRFPPMPSEPPTA